MLGTNLKVGALALIVIGFYTMVAHIIPQLQSEVPESLELGVDVTPEQLVAAGEQMFNGAGGCTACHGLGTRAPNLLSDHAGRGPIGSRCTSEFEADCKNYLYTSMTNPGDSVVPGFANIMPDVRRQLDGNQIWAIIAFLQSEGGDVTVTAADLPGESAAGAAGVAGAAGAAGAGAGATTRTATMDPRQLLQENACIGCHQLDGAGPPIGPSFDGIGSRLSADQIRLSVLDPAAEVSSGYEQFAAMMPKTFGEQLSAAQLEAIVQFLLARK